MTSELAAKLLQRAHQKLVQQSFLTVTPFYALATMWHSGFKQRIHITIYGIIPVDYRDWYEFKTEDDK